MHAVFITPKATGVLHRIIKSYSLLSCFHQTLDSARSLRMAISSLRFPLSPCLLKNPHSTPTPNFRLFRIPKLLLRPHCSSSSSSSSSTHKWQPFRKKKVVIRVGYVGSDYKGYFFYSLSIFIFLSNVLI